MEREALIIKSRLCLFGVNPKQKSEVYSREKEIGVATVYGTIRTHCIVYQRIKTFGVMGKTTIDNEKLRFLFIEQETYYTAIKEGENAVIKHAHLHAEVVSDILKKHEGKLWVFGPDALVAMIQEICDPKNKFSYFDHPENDDLPQVIVLKRESKNPIIPYVVREEEVITHLS